MSPDAVVAPERSPRPTRCLRQVTIGTLQPMAQAHCDTLACRDHVRAWLRGMPATLSASGGSIT